MAPKELLFLALMFCTVKRNTGQVRSVIFNLSEESLELSPSNSSIGGRVVFTCKDSEELPRPPIYILSISRTLPGQNESLITVLSFGNQQIKGPLKVPGATVKGNFTQRSLVLTMPNAKCADAGNYTCKMAYQNNNFNLLFSMSQTPFKVEVIPGPITMVAEPSGKSQWVANETLLIRCNGALGTVDETTTVSWVWEYAYKRNDVLEPWIQYPDTDDIRTEAMSQGGECYKRQISYLTRKLRVSDTDRVYRCFVVRNAIRYTQFAQMVEVGSVTEASATTS